MLIFVPPYSSCLLHSEILAEIFFPNLGIVDQFKVPIKFVGIGEGVDDLKVFNKREFVNSLFSKEDLV